MKGNTSTANTAVTSAYHLLLQHFTPTVDQQEDGMLYIYDLFPNHYWPTFILVNYSCSS